MTWEAAVRWALIRFCDTGEKHRVVAYRRPSGTGWGYMIKKGGR